MATPADAHDLRAGWQSFEAGDVAGALQSAEQSCARDPGDAGAEFLRAACLHRLRDLPRALAAFDRTLALAPGDRDAELGAIAVLCDLGRARDALSRCEALAAAWPDDASVRFAWGCAHEGARDLDAALACYEAALARDAAFRPALLNRGLALTRLGRLEEALENNLAAAAAYPDEADSHYNLAEVTLALGRPAAALEHAAHALALDSRHIGALCDRATALALLERFDDSKRAWDAARAVDAPAVDARWASGAPGRLAPAFSPEAVYLAWIWTRLGKCDWALRERFVGLVRELIAKGEPLPTDPPFAFAATTLPLEPAESFAMARAVGSHLERNAGRPLRRRSLRDGPRLRVGYLSPDFRHHVTARLVQPLLAGHDRARFEVFAYALMPDDGSPARQAISGAADLFRDLSAARRDAAAARIAADRIDILVDLGGHTEGARMDILALRPAPLQVAYLAFPSSTGAAFIDYALTDRTTVPPEGETWWSERLVFLPGTAFLYHAPDPLTLPRAERATYGLPADRPVFAAFHSAHKIGPESLDVWAAVLRAVPDGVLWLRDNGPEALRNVVREAASRDIAPTRLVFASDRLPLGAYLARTALADVFLDARCYNAMTTACDALWTGVPVVTLPGLTATSRAAASLLRAAGLPELLAANEADYVRLAVSLAAPSPLRTDVRRRLARARRESALFDAAGRVRDIEAAFIAMTDRCRRGETPRSFVVERVRDAAHDDVGQAS